MFDRPPPSAPQSTDEAMQRSFHDESVARLCRLYDDRLADAGASLSPQDIQELNAMAAIYDLDTERAPADVWRDLRAVITRQSGPDAEAVGQPVRVDSQALTIMIVEDDGDAAAQLTELLVDAGHSVVGPFHNAAAAEAAAALHAIDVALLDINLSDERNGVELAKVLTQRWNVRVVFISGDVATAAKHAGMAEALVLKPYTGGQVLDAVSRLAVA